ncbi:hypothetical protein PX554_16760 [Sphingomonas sp. H39-1-10]|uniref:hypothetical protein n=1 Tax=Sphingomonas pollutisoli TaxID=3030829 RepID=UPI0023B8CB47|nr:hypothetical protein [Sphingomonas pollutisoli]MDF0489788.1 hypothetical protein [Sphingomonas pollutisoli]
MAQPTDTVSATLATFPARRGLLALFVIVFLACCVGATLLPHDRHIRYQQFGGTAMLPLGWVYDRLHYDRTPIDIAIIGASRTEVGVSGPQVEAILTAKLGRTVHVANLSLPQDGRNLHYEMTKELLATHPEVRLILYSLIEHASRTGHPAFRDVADTSDVLRAPILLNPKYFDNLAYQPYRQLSLFLQTQMPGLFGVHRDFDPKRYAGPDHDGTLSHWSVRGNWVDRDTIHSAAELAKAAKGKVARRSPVFLGTRFREYEYVVERHYTRATIALAHAHHVETGFLYLPIYAHDQPIADADFYRARGFVLNAGAIGNDARNYSDYAHLNRVGSGKVSRWLAGWLASGERRGQLHFLPDDRAR